MARDPTTTDDESDLYLNRADTMPPEQRRRPQWVQTALWADVEGVFSLETGDEIPGTGFTVIRFLGDGRMGTVYAARGPDGEDMAVKVLRPETTAHPEALDHFFDVGRAVSELESEHLVQMQGVLRLRDERIAVVMDRVNGRRLSEIVQDGPVATPRAIGILKQVARGVQIAHAAGILHLDIKPSSLMVDTESDRPDRVLIKDFGMASVVGAVLHGGGTSSARYAAPETVRGEAPGVTTDVYGMGCLAFEILAGRPPFEASDPGELMRMHLLEEPPALGSIVPITDRVADVVARCLAKNPAERFRSMEAFEAALIDVQVRTGTATDWDDLPLPGLSPHALEAVEGLRTGSDSLGTSAARVEPAETSRKGVPWIAVTAAAGVLLIGGVWWMNRGDDAAPGPDDSAQAKRIENETSTPVVLPELEPVPEDDTGEPEDTGEAEPATPRETGDTEEPEALAEPADSGEAAEPAEVPPVSPTPSVKSPPPTERPALSRRERAEAAVELGKAALRTGKYNEARKQFLAATKADRKVAAARDGLCQVYLHDKDYPKAVEHGLAAVAFAPKAGSYRIHLGDALFRQGRARTALIHYEKAKALGKSGLGPRIQRATEAL